MIKNLEIAIWKRSKDVFTDNLDPSFGHSVIIFAFKTDNLTANMIFLDVAGSEHHSLSSESIVDIGLKQFTLNQFKDNSSLMRLIRSFSPASMDGILYLSTEAKDYKANLRILEYSQAFKGHQLPQFDKLDHTKHISLLK